jgi:hypothetical protein
MTENLICIKDVRQLDRLPQKLEVDGGKDSVVPLIPKAALGLHRLGFNRVRLLIELLNKDEREGVHESAIDLSKAWYDQLSCEMHYNGIDLLDCCRLQMLGFFQDVLAAHLIVPRLIEEFQPKKAFFFDYPVSPSYGNSMHDGTADVFEAVLQWELPKAGIDVFVKEKKIERSERSSWINYLRAKISGARKKFAKYSKTSRNGSSDPRRLRLDDIPRDKAMLVGYGSGYDLLVIWPYLKALAAEIDGFPVLLNAAPQMDTKTLRSSLSGEGDIRYLYVQDIPLCDSDEIDVGKCREACSTAMKERNESLPAILWNPLLEFQFIFLFENLVSSALDAARRAKFFVEEYRPSLLLDDYCAGHENRAWMGAANAAGIPSAVVPHGAINLLEFHAFNAHWAFAWGELGQKNFQLANPEKRDKVIVAGDPSMGQGCITSKRKKQNGNETVLLITGGFLHQVWTDMDFRGFISTWENLRKIAQERPAIKFIIKTHPSVRDLNDWYRHMVQEKGVANMTVVDDRKLEELLEPVFLSVLVGKPGTAGIVSAVGGVPFVYLDSMLCRHVPGYSIWCEENGVPRLTRAANLAQVIDRLFSNPSEREELLKKNEKFLRLYSSPFHPSEICERLGLRRASQHPFRRHSENAEK